MDYILSLLTYLGHYMFIKSTDGGLGEYAILQTDVLPSIPEVHRRACAVSTTTPI